MPNPYEQSNTNSTFVVNRDEIIRAAMLGIGKLGEGEVPTASEIQDCSFFLNMLVKQLQGNSDYSPGLKTFTRRVGYMFLGNTGVYRTNSSNWAKDVTQHKLASVNGLELNLLPQPEHDGFAYLQTSTGPVIVNFTNIEGIAVLGEEVNVLPNSVVYTFTENATTPIVIETANLRDSESNDQLVRLMDLESYHSLPGKANKTHLADPSALYFERQKDFAYLYCNVGAVRDTTKYLVIGYLEEAKDLLYAADEPCYTKEWYRPLVWSLAREITPMFNAEWTLNHQNLYVEAMKVARNVNPSSSSMHFQPNA
jgi:hypothetical protein